LWETEQMTARAPNGKGESTDKRFDSSSSSRGGLIVAKKLSE
jgi:hypothetical protein